MLFLSPRNSLEGQLSLVDACKCKVFLTSATCPPPVQAIVDARDIRHIRVPPLEDLLDGPLPKRRPPSLRTFNDMRHEPLAYLHSSGSTGLPKLIGWTFGCVHGHSAQLDFENSSGDRTLMQCLAQGGKNFLNCFPMFHAGGLWFPLAHELGLRIILPPPGQPVNADMVASILRKGNVDTACVPPAVLEDMSKKLEWRASLKDLKYILTGGAPLPKAVGDILQDCGPRIWNVHASTEVGFMPLLNVAKEDWLYARFAPGFGIELRPHMDDLYELVIVKDEGLMDKQLVFQNFPKLQEYPTQDLFRRHPDPKKIDYWQSCGRHDDVIVLLNGEKFNPRLMESTIQSHPLVSAALIFGRERFQCAVLIELHDPSKTATCREKGGIIKELWAVIEQANAQAPGHGKISRSLVAFTSPSKPMPRTPKKSVIRNATYELYASEINDLYASFESTTTNGIAEDEDQKMRDLYEISSLERLIRSINPAIPHPLEEDDSLFALGFDSLQVLQLVRAVRELSPKMSMEARTIYNNSTLATLSKVLRDPQIPSSDLSKRKEAVEAIITQYSSSFPKPHLMPPKIALLTGATGNLGSHILTKLLKSNNYMHIYCLVRTIPFHKTTSDPRIIYLESAFTSPQLGLSYDTYTHLLRTVTHVVHNAWTVNFNLPLSAFEEHIIGVRHVIDFCMRSTRRAGLLFVSSIASVMNANEDLVPEREFTDSSVAGASGYGESKHVAERVLAVAGRSEGLRYKIVRIGQIAGPVEEEGRWNPVEWVPSLVMSSTIMKCLPNSLGLADRVDWIPVDTVAQILVEILTLEEQDPAVYHVQNPQSTTWRELLPGIMKVTGEDVEIVSFGLWVKKLKTHAHVKEAEKDMPALRLLDFFEMLAGEWGKKIVSLDMENTMKVSEALRRVEPITGEMMGVWMKGWGF